MDQSTSDQPVMRKVGLKASIWSRETEWVLDISGTLNDCCFVSRHTEPLTTPLEDVAGLPTLYAGIDALKELASSIVSGEAFREQRFAEDSDADYFLRAQRRVQKLALAALKGQS